MELDEMPQPTPRTSFNDSSGRLDANSTSHLPAASQSSTHGLDGGSSSLYGSENGITERSTTTTHETLLQPPSSASSVRPVLWITEMLASAFSISCIAAMVAVLKALDNQPYEPWKIFRANITPNAVVAVLATGAKSSLLLAVASAIGQLKWTYFQQRPQKLIDMHAFDEASRGPLGSLRLLWCINVKAVVASIGAIITLLALGVEPLSQQLLSYPVALENSLDQAATIGAVHWLGYQSDHDAGKSDSMLHTYHALN